MVEREMKDDLLKDGLCHREAIKNQAGNATPPVGGQAPGKPTTVTAEKDGMRFKIQQ